MKQTKARTKVLEIFHQNPDRYFSAQEIYKLLIEENINLSTIYRTLTAFEKENLLLKQISPNKEAIYTLSGEEHGHVLECVKCHKKIRLNYCPFEEVNSEIYEKTGFSIEDENHVLYGTCNDCKINKKTSD